MDEYAELEAAFLAAVEAHETHPPRLYRGRDGIWRCPACDPPGLRERIVNLLASWVANAAYRQRQKNRVKRRRR